MTRQIGILVYPQFQLLDMSGPADAFHMANQASGRELYKVTLVSEKGGTVPSAVGVGVATDAYIPHRYDTFLVVGGSVPSTSFAQLDDLAEIAKIGAKRARRTASVCTGAFVLAAAGLLDGRSATTHWKHAAQLQRSYPKIKVDSDRIFIKDGDTWTSAGVSAGLDLALAMIEEDFGPDIARAAAQMLVVYHRRPGGQSQFSALLEMEPGSDRIRNVLTYIREHLTEPLSIDRLADVACLSPRQFGRAFLAETGETPAKAVERVRAEVARDRVENGSEPLEVIARNVGFIDPERMRRAFVRIFGHPPQSMRRMTAHDITGNITQKWRTPSQSIMTDA
ncbi:GlxA family transcriptional regulator [Tardiphaga sp. OK246]|uniref:GlxA family transcriptional regulator n=1 Tax=Tardiphaga sp. OK246 TaxID=1855307 RepID=UPI001AEFBB89|nr:GlxA family transcriptional regulator [Tardiphaga sp. OK246]